MATLKVRQFKDDVWISDDHAQKILDARAAQKEPRFYEFGTLQIPAGDIRAIMLDTHKSTPQDTGQFHYDLDNQEHRETIKGFEKELNGRELEQYLYDERIITKQKPPYDKFGYAIIYDRTNDYTEAWRKWNGLQDLRNRRNYASKKELEQLGSMKGELADTLSEEINVKDLF